MAAGEKWKIEVLPRRTTTAIGYGPASGAPLFVCAHGAGADQSSAFITRVGAALGARGIRVVTFNFLYTEEGRRVPDKTDLLETCFRTVVADAATRAGVSEVVLGGKSMGGRIATHLAAGDVEGLPRITSLVLFGYPLHPPGKPEKPRAEHLARISAPMLVVQGSRDPFGTPDELEPVFGALSAKTKLVVVEEGDHSYKVPKRAPRTQAQVIEDVHNAAYDWITGARG